jgi:hypothetical protein
VALGEKLVQAGILTREQWEEVEQAAAADGGFVGAALVERGLVPADALGRFLEEAFSIPTLAAGAVKPDPAAYRLAPVEFWREVLVVPLSRAGDILTVAITRPLDVFVLDRLKKEFGLAVRPVFAATDQLLKALIPADTGGEAPLSPESFGRPTDLEEAESQPAGPPTETVAGTDEAMEAAWLKATVVPEESESKAVESSLPDEADTVQGQGAAAAGGDTLAALDDQYENWDDEECLDPILALLDDGLGWVAVVGGVADRVPCLRALRRVLEERERRVVYFSAAERPYGELELLAETSDAVLMVEDLDELEGHVPEQALLLQEMRRAHERGSRLIVGADEPPAKLSALEPSLRVTVSLARVFPLARRLPPWMDAVVREATGLLEEAGLADKAEGVDGYLRSRNPSAAVSSAIDACKALAGGD